MNEVYESLKALSANEEAKKLFAEAKEPASVEEAAVLYADIAAKAGQNISKDAILEYLKEKEASQRAQSGDAECAVKEALDMNDLDNVAGGTEYQKHNTACDTTYDKGEWCWFSDSCSLVISYYGDGVGAPMRPVSWDDPDIEPEKDDVSFDGESRSSVSSDESDLY